MIRQYKVMVGNEKKFHVVLHQDIVGYHYQVIVPPFADLKTFYKQSWYDLHKWLDDELGAGEWEMVSV